MENYSPRVDALQSLLMAFGVTGITKKQHTAIEAQLLNTLSVDAEEVLQEFLETVKIIDCQINGNHFSNRRLKVILWMIQFDSERNLWVFKPRWEATPSVIFVAL